MQLPELKTKYWDDTTNPEMLKFILDHLKTRKMCKNALKLPFVIMHVPDRYTTQKMYYKVILEHAGMLRFIPDWYKNQKIFDKAVHNYSHILDFITDCYMNQIMCDEAVDTYSSAIQFIFECCKI